MADEILLKCEHCGRIVNDLEIPLMVRIVVGSPAHERTNLEDLADAADEYLTAMIGRTIAGNLGQARDDLCYECFRDHFTITDALKERAARRLPDAAKKKYGLDRFVTPPGPPAEPPGPPVTPPTPPGPP